MLRHQSNRCPICRTPVESLLEIKVAAKQPEPELPTAASAAAGAGASGGSDSGAGGSNGATLMAAAGV
jgi:hypothetical protein